MKASPESEIKKIYQKSVRLLNDKQARLMDMQQVLKKAVIRLSLASRSDNNQVNNVLFDIKDSVTDDIDIEILNKHLDALFLLINHADFRIYKTEKTALYTYFNKVLENSDDSTLSTEVIKIIKELVANEQPDAEISAELLKSLKALSSSNQQYSDSINLFINDISESTGFTFSRGVLDDSEIMQDLAIELAKYVYTEKNNNKKSGDDTSDEGDINLILNELVNQMIVPAAAKQGKFKVIKTLNGAGKKNWKDIVDALVQLVNKSISSVQSEKESLEAYLIKMSSQLTDIESFMHKAYKGTEETTTLSLALTDSVEQGVSSIETTITSSTDLTALKRDVAINLKEIRKHVIDYKHAEKIKHDISLQTYSKMINEISSSQKESAELQAQLHESKIQLLRDPLTGIGNRLAYDERILVEINRWKRTHSPLCLALWDIDRFKLINDKFGHAVGDRILKVFADIIQKKTRKTDLFARIGGEEFALIMTDTSLAKAMALNDKLRITLEECNFHYEGKRCEITSSVGIAEFRRGDNVDTILEKADKALYQSKNNGRNRCTIFEDN